MAHIYQDCPGGAVVKYPPANVGDSRNMGSIPGSSRSPGEGNGNLHQYSYLENSMVGLQSQESDTTEHSSIYLSIICKYCVYEQ